MQPIVDHIHITCYDLGRAEAFYDRFLPLLGFDLRYKERDQDPAHDYRLVEYGSAALSVGLVSRRSGCPEGVNRRRAGSLHHLAFRVPERADVDRLYHQVRALGARVLHPPRLYPQYCPDYYAFFFKDSEGTELEIVAFDRPSYFTLTKM